LQATPEPDRIAVLLHGHEGRPFREVGALLARRWRRCRPTPIVSGRQAKVVDGTTHYPGPVIGVSPHLVDDGSLVEFEVEVAATVETRSLGP
jgi:hypothetical protein